MVRTEVTLPHSNQNDKYTCQIKHSASPKIFGMENYPLLSDALAETIEELRIERGLTKTALADFAALQRFYLLNIEKKTNRPTVNAVFFICDALSIRPSDFFLRVEKKMKELKQRS